MKNILSENLIRFGAKNLTESQKAQLLAEQSYNTNIGYLKLDANISANKTDHVFYDFRTKISRDDRTFDMRVAEVKAVQLNPTYEQGRYSTGFSANPQRTNIQLEIEPLGRSFAYLFGNLAATQVPKYSLTVEKIEIAPAKGMQNVFSKTTIPINKKVNFTNDYNATPITVNVPFNPPQVKAITAWDEKQKRNVVDRKSSGDGSARLYYENKTFGSMTIYGTVNAPYRSLEDLQANVDKFVEKGQFTPEQAQKKKEEFARNYPNGQGGEPTAIDWRNNKITIKASKGNDTKTAIGRPKELRAQQRQN